VDDPFKVAMIDAVRADVTDPMVALNPAVELPGWIHALLGTVTAGSLLDRLTTV
jgi:hypothetical protein